MTGLMYAAKYNQLECIKLLLPYEKFINTQENLTALMVAVLNNNFDSVKLLAQHQAGERLSWNIDLQAQTFRSLISQELNQISMHLKKGMTALTISIQLGNLQIAKYLFQLEQIQSDISNLTKQLYLQDSFIDLSQITQYSLKSDMLNRNPLFYLVLAPQKSRQYQQYLNTILKNLSQQSPVYDAFGLSPLHYAIITQDEIAISTLYDKFRAYKTSTTCKWIGSNLSCQELATKLGFQLVKQQLSDLEQKYQDQRYGNINVPSKFDKNLNNPMDQTVENAKSKLEQIEQLEQQLSQIEQKSVTFSHQQPSLINNLSISETQQSYDFTQLQQQQEVKPVSILQSQNKLEQKQLQENNQQQEQQVQIEQPKEDNQEKLRLSDLRLNTVINQELLNSHANQSQNKMNAALIEEKMNLLNQNTELQQKLLKQQQDQLQCEQKQISLQNEIITLKNVNETQKMKIQQLEEQVQQIDQLNQKINQQTVENNNLTLQNKQQENTINELNQQIQLLNQQIETQKQQFQLKDQQIQQQTQQIKQQSEQIETLQKNEEKYEQLKVQYTQLKTQCEQTENLLNKTEKEKQELQQRIQSQQQQISGLEAANGYLEDQIQQISEDNQSIQQQLQTKTQALNSLDLMKIINQLQSGVNQLLNQQTQLQKMKKQ